jgi:hypothetical protein
MCWNSVKTIEFFLIWIFSNSERTKLLSSHKLHAYRPFSPVVFTAKMYIVLGWAESNELPK